MVALLEDIDGQIDEALSRKDWFDKWGIHYLLYLGVAHKNQIRINFKDPGPLVYGSQVYDAILLKAKKAFLSVPAPTPSHRNNNGSSGSSYVSSAPVNMSSYYNMATGCFIQGNVLMGDGSL